MTTRRMGCPAVAAVCHSQTVRLMKHKVRTTYGILESSITWDSLINPGGIGQGNGAGPQSYHGHLLIKIMAYEALKNHDMSFKNPDGTSETFQWLVGFVDNNTILLMLRDPSFRGSMIKEILMVAKECIDIWHKLVVIAGAELEVAKTKLSAMCWVRQHGTTKGRACIRVPADNKLSGVHQLSTRVKTSRSPKMYAIMPCD